MPCLCSGLCLPCPLLSLCLSKAYSLLPTWSSLLKPCLGRSNLSILCAIMALSSYMGGVLITAH
jgi:hypothetical protein